jgi:hypothetical protein
MHTRHAPVVSSGEPIVSGSGSSTSPIVAHSPAEHPVTVYCSPLAGATIFANGSLQPWLSAFVLDELFRVLVPP